jgi:hypothetical protein
MSPSGVILTSDKDYDNGLKALNSVAKGNDRRAAKDKRIHTGVNVKNLTDSPRKNTTRRIHQEEQVGLLTSFMRDDDTY